MRRADRTLIIKLGGSVVTDKKRAFTPNCRSIRRIAKELARRKEHLIVLNGAGSFGHIPAKKYGLDHGFDAHSKLGFTKTKVQLLRLQEIIASILCDHGVPVVPLNPSSFMLARAGRLSHVGLEPIHTFLELGLVPLFGGDLIADVEHGWRVVSADQMASWIAPRVSASMIIYGTDVDGLYKADPRLSKTAELIRLLRHDEISGATGFAKESRMPDVTAGMRGKLLEARDATRRGVTVVMMNLNRPEDLRAILAGRQGRWTTILPRNS